MFRMLYPLEIGPVTLHRRLCGTSKPAGWVRKICPHRVPNPETPSAQRFTTSVVLFRSPVSSRSFLNASFIWFLTFYFLRHTKSIIFYNYERKIKFLRRKYFSHWLDRYRLNFISFNILNGFATTEKNVQILQIIFGAWFFIEWWMESLGVCDSSFIYIAVSRDKEIGVAPCILVNEGRI